MRSLQRHSAKGGTTRPRGLSREGTGVCASVPPTGSLPAAEVGLVSGRARGGHRGLHQRRVACAVLRTRRAPAVRRTQSRRGHSRAQTRAAGRRGTSSSTVIKSVCASTSTPTRAPSAAAAEVSEVTSAIPRETRRRRQKNLWASSLSKRVENQNSKLSDGVTADEGAEHGSRARGGAQGRGHLPPDSVRRGATRPGFAHVGLAAGPSARAGCIANQILLRSLDRRHRAAAAGPAEGARPAQGSLARHGHPRRHRRWSVLSRVPADAHPPAGQRKETWGVPTLPHRDASLALLQCASRGAQSLALTICLLHAPAAASFCPARCAPAPTPSSLRARNTSRDAPRGQAREGA